jgi:hypothetical protein
MKLLLPLDVIHPYRDYVSQLERLIPLKETDILLLYVAENMSSLQSILTSIGKDAGHVDNQLKERAKAILDEVAAGLRAHCKSVVTQVIQGSPPFAIEKLASKALT